MNTEPLYIAQLVSKKFRQELTKQEMELFNLWIDSDPRNKELLAKLEQDVKLGLDTHIFKKFDEHRALEIIQKKRFRRKIQFWSRIAAAIAVVFSLSLLIFQLNKENVSSRIVVSTDAKFNNDVLPAIKGAKIIKSDGTELKVDDNVRLSTDGRITTDGNKVIAQVPSSTINTLIVPAANFLNLTLADGTKVWVNARSELRFPTGFGGNERKVYLKGEAYFEVAKDEKHPFVVETSAGSIKVLGTHFNVSAYDEKPVTSLKEGKVIVFNEENQKILTPGMKAEINGELIEVRQADLQKDLAWKDNEFYFKGDNIIRIAKQLEKWYDLEISFEKGVSFSNTYSGGISRESNLSEVLKMLEFATGLNFKIEKNRLLILNKKVWNK